MTLRQDQDALDYLETQVLLPGERVVWKGRPNPWRCARNDTFSFMFGIPVAGVSLLWIMIVAATGSMTALLGAPFLAAGAWLVRGPMTNYWRATRAYYAITDKRVIILAAGRDYRVVTFVPADITDYERRSRRDGSGSIRLRNTPLGNQKQSRASYDFYDGLWGLEDVRTADDGVSSLRTRTART